MPSSATVEQAAACGSAQVLGRRALGYARFAGSALARRPPLVTATLVVCIVTTWLRLEVGGQLPAARFVVDAFSGRALANEHFRILATSTLLTRDAFMVASISISLLVTMGTYEVLAGPLRAAALAVVASVLGPLSVTAGLGLLVALGSTWASDRLGTLDIGASAIVAMSSGAIAGIVRNRWFTAGLVLFLLGGLAVHHQLADWEHVLVFPWGLLIGRLSRRAGVPTHRRLTWWGSAGYLLACAGLLAVALPPTGRLLPSPRKFVSSTGQTVSAPRIVDTTYPSPAMHARRHVLVLLPAGYDSSRARFPVIELLHGSPGHPEDLFSLGELMSSAQAPGVAPFIAIIPDANGPRVKESWDANIPNQPMGTAVSVDLRRWAAATFRITSSWSYAGLSSGAFGAAYLPLLDRAPTHAVCGLSGYYDTAQLKIFARLPKASRSRLDPILHPGAAAPLTFLAYGAGDVPSMRQTIAFEKALRADHRHVVVRVYSGQHQWTVWRSAFLACFRIVNPAPPPHR